MKKYVKEYKGFDVIEGATHFSNFQCDEERYLESGQYFWSQIGDTGYALRASPHSGKFSNEQVYLLPDYAFELPEEECLNDSRDYFISKSRKLYEENCISPLELVELMYDEGARYK